MVDLTSLSQGVPDPNAPGAPAPPPQSLQRPQPQAQPTYDQTMRATPVQTTDEKPQDSDDPRFLDNRPPQMYHPHDANRDHSEWHQPSWKVRAQMNYPGNMPGPFAPSPFEGFGLIGNSGGALGSNDVPAVAGPSRAAQTIATQFGPIFDFISKGQFTQHFNAAALGRLQMAEAQMHLNIEQAYYAQREYMMNMKSIFAENKAGVISDDEMKYRIEHHVFQTGDEILNNILQNKGAGAAYKFLQQRDKWMQDMLAGSTAIQKATKGGYEGGAALKSLGVNPEDDDDSFPDTSGNDNSTANDDPLDNTPSQIPANDDYLGSLQKQMKASSAEMQAAEERAAGGQSDTYNNLAAAEKAGGGRYGNQVALEKQKLDNIVARIKGDGNKALQSPDDPKIGDAAANAEARYNQLSKINRKLADRLRGYTNYDVDPMKDNSIKDDQKGQMITLAQQMDHNYKQANFDQIKKEFGGTGLAEKKLSYLPQIYTNYVQLMRGINKTGENTPIPPRVLDAWLKNNYSGDPEYDVIFDNLRTLATSIGAIQSAGGKPAVTSVHDLLKHMHPYDSGRTLRAQMQNNVMDAFSVAIGYQSKYKELTGKNTLMPGISAQDYRGLRAIALQNVYTGQMPSNDKGRNDVPEAVLSVSRDPKQAYKGLRYPENLPALTLGQARAVRAFIAQHENDDDVDMQKQVQDARRRLGPAIDLLDPIKGVDD